MPCAGDTRVPLLPSPGPRPQEDVDVELPTTSSHHTIMCNGHTPQAMLENGLEAVTTSSDGADSDIRLRFLCPPDIDDVKSLCRQVFPIEYPDFWYEDITTNPNLYAVAATLEGRIIGVLVTEIKRLAQCNSEDRTILAASYRPSTAVAYILSLGVRPSHRRRGVASLLLNHLLSYLRNGFGTHLGVVRAVYLHVLHSNTDAIRFYERRSFVRHAHLHGYYVIEGESQDGFTYVLYINGGKPPWQLRDCLYWLYNTPVVRLLRLAVAVPVLVFARLCPVRLRTWVTESLPRP